MKHFVIALLLVTAILVGREASALTVTPTSDPDVLANVILGTGVAISNATYSANTGNGSGTFTGGIASGIGIGTGIILTSGTAAGAVGPNTLDNFTGAGTFSRLDFEFTTTTGGVFFNYVFASEEYNEFTNSQFNDAFTLQVDGVNIALIPGTSTPVQINTVNGGNPFGTSASHPELFHNNDPSDGGPFFDLQYDGFTDVFTAQATGLALGTTHTMSFFITDTSDSNLDSAVFVEGGSFGGEPPAAGVAEPGAGLLILAGLAAAARLRRRRRR